MLWLKAFHIIFVVCWFAGLFYLPRLFVYHASTTDEVSLARFKLMERRLYYGIMMPGACLTLIFGLGLFMMHPHWYWQQGWMKAKLGCVFLLYIYQILCGVLLSRFKQDQNRYSAKFYRWFNEVPTILLCAIVILVVVQPA